MRHAVGRALLVLGAFDSDSFLPTAFLWIFSAGYSEAQAVLLRLCLVAAGWPQRCEALQAHRGHAGPRGRRIRATARAFIWVVFITCLRTRLLG